jgi:hypothetical protein
MRSHVITLCLLAQPPDTFDAVRAEYLVDAQKYQFHHDVERQHELKLLDKPVMRWANDDDWSGDVFVWLHAGRPEVIGCILSGPGAGGRPVYHEFHLLAEQPIGATDLETNRRWQPTEGLARTLVPDAPAPADTAAGRLTQMRQMARNFTAHMEADGSWELRLLPQPLFRYGEPEGAVVDGALFTYVWTKGTDPEVVLLLECQTGDNKTGDKGPAWHFSPVRFSNRSLALQYKGKEVWSAASHQEPSETNTLVYTTAYARTMSPQPESP